LRNQVEWSIDFKTKVLAESFCSNFISFVKIDNLPLLVLSSVIVPNSNGSTFFILSSFNIKDLVVLPVDELTVLILE